MLVGNEPGLISVNVWCVGWRLRIFSWHREPPSMSKEISPTCLILVSTLLWWQFIYYIYASSYKSGAGYPIDSPLQVTHSSLTSPTIATASISTFPNWKAREKSQLVCWLVSVSSFHFLFSVFRFWFSCFYVYSKGKNGKNVQSKKIRNSV